MGTRDPRVDAYIARSAEFARPILTHIRETVHAACPDVVETIKWGMPSFEYHGILCGMAAFKGHCSLNFWRGAQIFGDTGRGSEAMGQFGRITAVSDLPPKRVLMQYLKTAMKLNEERAPTPRAAKRARRPVARVPADLAAALAANRKAKATFDGFPPSARRDYIEWITEAKREDTRKRRLATAIEWMAEGKQRNWKYMR